MPRIVFDNISVASLIRIGDGALSEREYQLAAGCYRTALKYAEEADRPRLLSRLGLAENPKPRTPPMLEALKALEQIETRNLFVGEGLATWFKTTSFFEDPRFLELAAKHAGLLPLANWHWNLNTALWAIRRAKALPGDLVELGVFKGHTTLFAAEYLDFAYWPKTWFLYDTFDGIPDDQLDAGWSTTNNIYKGTFSYEEVRDRFAHIPNIRVIQGRVPEVLDAGCPEAISFLHIDLNNATAEIAALDYLFDRVTPGGAILFDDFCWAVSRAQYLAERKWFESRGFSILELPTGQGLFVKG